jgi:hypothetical protein
MTKEKSAKVQSSIKGYTLFVLDGLVGIYGKTRSEVVGYILKSWIRDDRNELKENSLGIMDWRKTMRKKKPKQLLRPR